MTSEIRRTIVYYYVLRAIAAFGYGSVLATYVAFLTKKGLTLFEAHVMNFIFFATLLVFEVPTGAFADRCGRKFSFVLSCFLMSLSKFIYAFAPSFWWFVVAELISGIGVAFSGGAIQAWFVDRLRILGHTEPIIPIFAREQLIKNALIIVSVLIGSKIAEYNSSYPWFFTAICMFTAGVLALVVLTDDEPIASEGRVTLLEKISSIKPMIVGSYNLARKNDVVVAVVMMGLAQHFATQAPNMQWQPFFIKFFPRESTLGMIFALTVFLQFLGSGLAPYARRFFSKERQVLAIVQVAMGVGIMLTTLWSAIVPIFMSFALFQFMRGMYVPLKDAYLNHHIPSEQRATLISFEALSHHVGGMMGLLVAGLLGQYLSMSCAWVVAGLLLVVTGIRRFYTQTLSTR